MSSKNKPSPKSNSTFAQIPSDEFDDTQQQLGDDDEDDCDDDNDYDNDNIKTKRPARSLQNYASVPTQDEGLEYPYEHSHNNDGVWNVDPQVQLRKYRTRRPPQTERQFGWTTVLCLLMFALLLTGLSLIGWRAEQMHSSSNNDGDDGEGISIVSNTTPGKNGDDTTPTLAKVNPNIQSSRGDVVIHYDPKAALYSYNPFDLNLQDAAMQQVVPPNLVAAMADEDISSMGHNLGYLMQPNLVQNQLVFVTEGDLYLTHVPLSNGAGNDNNTSVLPAMKLTTTIGNVRTPVINPVFPYLVAFTATYTGRREVYLLDLRPTHRHVSATRLTYWPTQHGVTNVAGWKDDGLTVVFSAMNREAGFRDLRLYGVSVAQQQQAQDATATTMPLRILQIAPIPLTQALEGSWDGSNDCLYFTRFAQSSNTIRYVGGTAESLWVFCSGQKEALALTADYRGTSKTPNVVTLRTSSGRKVLLFLSDRTAKKDGWIPADMNLFAMELGDDVYANGPGKITQLTHVSCQHDGMSLQEYTVDAASGNIVLRIGADLYWMTADELERKLDGDDGSSLPDEHSKLPIAVYSDFSQHFERILPVELSRHLTSVDVYESAFDTTQVLMGLRGQLFVTPVIADLEKQDYQGAGMNLPPRRYRVAPGSTTGGMVRILTARHVPLWQEVGKSGRRLALVLATDPRSETAEHGFYLIEMQSDSLPSFVDTAELPTPFVGGHVNGGSVAEGGLGSVDENSVTVSPCGRRFAWFDKDGRICVMTIPLYKQDANYVVLPDQNENGEPMTGDDPDLEWSPGGRYLAVTHQARNQFRIISIVDCGDPDAGNDEVADITIGRIVQATPDRFNSGDVYWGKTTLDIALSAQWENLGPLLGMDGDNALAGATTLYFLSDRDIITDVSSPWGTRSPAPHFPKRFSIYALPLIDDTLRHQSPFNPRKGIYGGGGASELWVNDIIALDVQMEALSAAQKTAGVSEAVAAAAAEKGDNNNGSTGGRRLTKTKQALATAIAKHQRYLRSLHEDDDDEDFEDGPDVIPANPVLDDENQDGTEGQEGETDTDASDATENNTGEKGEQEETSSPSPNPTRSPTAAADKGEEDKPLPLTPNPSPSSIAAAAAPKAATKRKKTPKEATKKSSSITQPKVPTVVADAPKSAFPKDTEIFFGTSKMELAERAYRVAGIPPGKYDTILSQADDGSFVVLEKPDQGSPAVIKIFSAEVFPSDRLEAMLVDIPGHMWMGASLSTTRKHLVLIYSSGLSDVPGGLMKIVPNTALGLASLLKDIKFTTDIADTIGLSLSVWPSLEYEQMYNDAWRLLRDYFYDTGMNGIDWREMHKRYKPLVKRCAKREELDDILEQMAAELSALHVFVYGGEYPDPLHDDNKLKAINEIASLGATLDRSAEWKGYVVSSIPERDPDFNLLDGKPVYSPLSDKVLSLTGQRGLQVGDVIVGINGESVMRVPDIHMLLRGKAKESVRLDVLRLASGSSQSSTSGRRRVDDNDNGHMENNDETPAMRPEPVITVPLTPMDAETLLYQAWEWKTRQMATALAARHNFTVGYLHLQSMEEDDADAFARGFYPNYNKDALIVDVRHNHGGNIDSWLLDVLQRQAWMYWQGRATNIDNGGLGWDEQFAFRGHLVVLVDEKTSSDGEGFSRGVLELGLGVLIGRRTWGGGIWLSSDNHLVDGGIATAPEIGTYNDKFGWGLGIENMGVEPDVDVDNNPRRFYDGQDEQLEKAIQYLADWLKKEPIVRPKDPGPKKDMSLPKEARNCPA